MPTSPRPSSCPMTRISSATSGVRSGSTLTRLSSPLCCDAKTKCQPLEAPQPGLPLGRDHISTRMHDYLRYGSICLSAALSYLEAKLIYRAAPPVWNGGSSSSRSSARGRWGCPQPRCSSSPRSRCPADLFLCRPFNVPGRSCQILPVGRQERHQQLPVLLDASPINLSVAHASDDTSLAAK